MPRVRTNRNHHFRNQHDKDNQCLEYLLLALVGYMSIVMWSPNCSAFFNSYSFSAYSFMLVVRRYQHTKME